VILVSVLPEGLAFLSPGWWVVHGVAIGLVFVYGYRRGRNDERRERRRAEGSATPPRTPDRAA
jgi:hypothetical protein